MDKSVKVPVVCLKNVRKTPATNSDRLHIKNVRAPNQSKKGARCSENKTRSKQTAKATVKEKRLGGNASQNKKAKLHDKQTDKKQMPQKTKGVTHISEYFQRKKKAVIVEARSGGRSPKEKKNAEKATCVSTKSSRLDLNVIQCPICTRPVRNYDEHIQLHKDKKLKHTCCEKKCGAQFQLFSRMKAHFVSKHKKIIISDRKGGYKIQENGKMTDRRHSGPNRRNIQKICRFSETFPVNESPAGNGKPVSDDVMHTESCARGIDTENAFGQNSSQDQISVPAPGRVSYFSSLPSVPNFRQYNVATTNADSNEGTQKKAIRSRSFDFASLPNMAPCNNTEGEPIGRAFIGLNENAAYPMMHTMSQPDMNIEGAEVPTNREERIISLIDLNLLQPKTIAPQEYEHVGMQETGQERNSGRKDDAEKTPQPGQSCAVHGRQWESQVMHQEGDGVPVSHSIKVEAKTKAEPDCPIKKEPEDTDAGMDLVLEDYDTVIHLPKQTGRSRHNQGGYSITFKDNDIHIKRRRPAKLKVNSGERNEIKTEPIVIDDEDEAVILID